MSYETKIINALRHIVASEQIPKMPSDYSPCREPIKEKIDWSSTYRKEDLEDASWFLSKETNYIQLDAKIKFLNYDEVYPWEILVITNRKTGEIKPLTKKSTFGWGKNMPYKLFDVKFYLKYERYPIGLHEKMISPSIIINGVIGDGVGRALTANALGQKVRVAKFQTEKDQ